MKYKCEVFISGSIGRPCYDGFVTINTSDPNPDFQDLVHQKLKQTSFPEIWKDSVRVKRIEVVQ